MDWAKTLAGHAQICFFWNAPLEQQGMHIAAHTGTEMVVKKACPIGLRSCLEVAKGENSSGKQTGVSPHGMYAQNTRATVYRPPNCRGDLPML
jgi:hypothetical protein